MTLYNIYLNNIAKRTIYYGSSPHIHLYSVPLDKYNRPSIFSRVGLKLRLQLAKFMIQNLIATWRMKLTLNGGFKKPVFLKDSCQLYEDMCSAISKQDMIRLRQITTPDMFAILSNEIKKSLLKPIQWSRSPPFHTNIQRISSVKIPGLDSALHEYYQVAVRFQSNQCIHAPSIPSNIKSETSVIEYYVFERYINDPNSTWKIAARVYPQ